jgi:hypothetical protein
MLLRQGEQVWHKHIDELTLEDTQAKVEYEKEADTLAKRAHRAAREAQPEFI